jgi:hypothetical protein
MRDTASTRRLRARSLDRSTLNFDGPCAARQIDDVSNPCQDFPTRATVPVAKGRSIFGHETLAA